MKFHLTSAVLLSLVQGGLSGANGGGGNTAEESCVATGPSDPFVADANVYDEDSNGQAILVASDSVTPWGAGAIVNGGYVDLGDGTGYYSFQVAQTFKDDGPLSHLDVIWSPCEKNGYDKCYRDESGIEPNTFVGEHDNEHSTYFEACCGPDGYADVTLIAKDGQFDSCNDNYPSINFELGGNGKIKDSADDMCGKGGNGPQAALFTVRLPCTKGEPEPNESGTPDVSLHKTVSTDGSCGEVDLVEGNAAAGFYYCYTIANVGDGCLTLALTDDDSVSDTTGLQAKLDAALGGNTCLPEGESVTIVGEPFSCDPSATDASDESTLACIHGDGEETKGAVTGTDENGATAQDDDPAGVVIHIPEIVIDLEKTASTDPTCGTSEEIVTGDDSTVFNYCHTITNNGNVCVSLTLEDAESVSSSGTGTPIGDALAAILEGMAGGCLPPGGSITVPSPTFSCAESSALACDDGASETTPAKVTATDPVSNESATDTDPATVKIEIVVTDSTPVPAPDTPVPAPDTPVPAPDTPVPAPDTPAPAPGDCAGNMDFMGSAYGTSCSNTGVKEVETLTRPKDVITPTLAPGYSSIEDMFFGIAPGGMEVNFQVLNVFDTSNALEMYVVYEESINADTDSQAHGYASKNVCVGDPQVDECKAVDGGGMTARCHVGNQGPFAMVTVYFVDGAEGDLGLTDSGSVHECCEPDQGPAWANSANVPGGDGSKVLAYTFTIACDCPASDSRRALRGSM